MFRRANSRPDASAFLRDGYRLAIPVAFLRDEGVSLIWSDKASVVPICLRSCISWLKLLSHPLKWKQRGAHAYCDS